MLIVDIYKLLFGMLLSLLNFCDYIDVMIYTKPLLYCHGNFQSLSVNKKNLQIVCYRNHHR